MHSQLLVRARLYTGPAPAVALDRLFGIASFELG
jgi:hypothetical protein